MLNVIPLPAKTEERSGYFPLTPETGILTDDANRWNADFLHDLLAAPTSLHLPVRTGSLPAKNAILLRLDPALARLGDEGYRLEVQPEAVTVDAPTTTGVFHGLQTLRQLLPVAIEEHRHVDANWRIPCLVIEDKPRFSWRGFMLDEGRYFHGKETVLQTLDLMALQKLNVLHWHLTEDQGWRIEIKKYPRLTEVGSKRAGTSKTMLGRKHNGIPHGGFYTQEEIREIVAYAARRHITIVPEIEIPGHSLAALASYPELSCTGGPFEVATHFGIFPDIYCAGKETTFAFLQDVIDEVLALFPSSVIHIGGDEAPKKRWRACPDCQRRVREEGLEDEHALQVYFTNRIGAYLAGRGRRLMGWNQILEPGLAQEAVVHYWLGDQKKLVQAIKNERRQVVMSTYLDAYLDHGYSLMPLSRAYHYDPILPGLNVEEEACILGLEFPLWTEWVPTQARLDYQTYPRLTAMAETAWTPKDRKDYADFCQRLVPFLKRLDRLGVRYAPLGEVEPPKWKQWLGAFSILLPQEKVAPPQTGS